MKSHKKLLLTFDLNCLLGYVAPAKNFLKENISSIENISVPVKNTRKYAIDVSQNKGETNQLNGVVLLKNNKN